MNKELSITLRDEELQLSTGKWAKQSLGSVVLKWNNLVILANSNCSSTTKDDIDFLPLTIEYREKFYSSGKIPGGFLKKEGKPSDREVLSARLIDRPIRPLFPNNFFNEIQVFATLLSADKKYITDIHSITAVSASLLISNIPFDTPVSGVRVCMLDGKYITFPTCKEQEESQLNLILAGTMDGVTMIEGSADEVSEEDMLKAVEVGQLEIKRICQLQLDFCKIAKSEKSTIPLVEKIENIELKKEVHDFAFENIQKANAIKNKLERQEQIDNIIDETTEKILKKLEANQTTEQEIEKTITQTKKILEEFEIEIVREQIFKNSIRADGRKLNEIRDISIEVGVLPSVHGSALFTRGETQSLGVVTLGGEHFSQLIDDIDGLRSKYFYLHYNFPPYCVGEVRRYISGSRREIGHGYLAENALRSVIPTREKFPYVIRIVSEILESNGSSSMASVCSGVIAMMDAGVPIKRPVAGIAMGLIKEEDKYAILTDIAGLEDHFGDMDFKVAGTDRGITAFQMDLKIPGIDEKIMEKALEQAKIARLEILKQIEKVISKPRENVSKNAPIIQKMTIDKKQIGELIGPGGRNIRSIIEKTGAEINVDDEGNVLISATNMDSFESARKSIELQFEKVQLNHIYNGEVKTITKFGAFIEILPGKEGLCHISEISNKRVDDITDIIQEGDMVDVKVIRIDNRTNKMSLSMKSVSA